MPIYHIQWDTETNVSTLQMDNKLLHYPYNSFGPVVHFCTEYKHDIYTFQCHPNYGSPGPIYDWMIIKFNIGLFPCQLTAVVLDDSTSAKEVHLVVQSTKTTNSCIILTTPLVRWFTFVLSINVTFIHSNVTQIMVHLGQSMIG
jgi:hypothetical protein